jgi:hypothetical protein
LAEAEAAGIKSFEELNDSFMEVDPLVVELRDGLLMDHTVTL